MAFDRTTIQKFTAHDAPDWVQVGEHPAYVGYLADEAEGADLGLAYIRFRKGVTFEFLWAYDEVAVVTEGRLIVRVGDETVTAGPGEVVHMPAGVPGVFEIDEDMEAVCVHYPTDAKAGREWDGAERMPPESDIRLVSSDVVWVTDRAPRVDAMAVLPTADRGAIGQWLDDRTDVFAYLNNDVDAHAVTDAQWLRDHVQ